MTDEIRYYGDQSVDCDCGKRGCDCDSREKEREQDGASKCRCGESHCNSEIGEEELQEIYHDAVLGKISVEILKPICQDTTYKGVLKKQYDGYDAIAQKMEDYAERTGVKLKDPTGFAKGMMYCTTMMNTVKDKSCSKLAEIMIQGINMGIISLTKISNKLANEGKSNVFVDEMSDLLEKYLTETKEFL